MKSLLSSILLLLTLHVPDVEAAPFVISDGLSLQQAFKLVDRIEANETLTKDELISAFSAMGYLRGFLGMAVGWSRNDPSAPFKLPEKGIGVGQLQQIIVKFLADHPERLHESADRLLYDSLVQAFPNSAK
jgi:hypothetical protein